MQNEKERNNYKKETLKKGKWFMKLGKYLSSLTKPEIEELKELLNLTEDEEIIFIALSKGKSREEICYISKISLRTLDRRIECIKNKKEKIVKNKEKQEGNYGRSTY